MEISSPEVQQFIRDHENDDEHMLVLKQKEIFGIPTAVIADQIAGRRKAKEKLPLYFNIVGIVYPPSLNLEQCSSEQTAKLKSHIVDRHLHHKRVCVDLTGGFGVDAFFFTRVFEKVIYVEPNVKLSEIAKQNHYTLEANNVEYVNSSAEEFLNTFPKADLIYIDPSRRSSDGKIFSLSDSEPNVVSLQQRIFESADNLLIKASPLLDLQLGISELKFVNYVYVVAVNNEVKEVLFFLRKDFIGEPEINAINIKSSATEYFEFKLSEEKMTQVEFGDPQTYLFEPNASILKAGAFKSIAKTFELKKLSPSTHLYTSDQLRKQFPGRIFRINSFVKPDPKIIQHVFPDGKANVITRNYPLSVDELKKKIRINDGGEDYLIGFSGMIEKFLCAAERIQ